MMTADAGWLSAIALTYLVVINALANGCRLALRDMAAEDVDWSGNLARSLSAAAMGMIAQAKKPSRKTRRRPARRRTTTPRLTAVPNVGAAAAP